MPVRALALVQRVNAFRGWPSGFPWSRAQPHVLPVGLVLAAFGASRALVAAAGVRFDTGTLGSFWQLLDTDLLHHRLAESLFYQHSQPPLFNALVGVTLKAFPSNYAGAFHVEYLLLGLAGTLGMYWLGFWVSSRRMVAVAIALLFALSPAAILHENWLFYDYPTAVLLVLTLVALERFLSTGRSAFGSAFFALLATLAYMRSTFQIIWMLLALLLVVWIIPGRRRTVLLCAAAPLLAVLALYAKNAVVFGVPSTSSWFGMNVAEPAIKSISGNERQRLVQQGTVSDLVLVDVFSPPDVYLKLVQPPQKRGIPALDRTGGNHNNLVYVRVSRQYLRDTLHIIEQHPGSYLRQIAHGVRIAFKPADDYLFVEQNRRHLHSYNGVFDTLVYWRLGSRFSGAGLALVLAYLVALTYGAVLMVRLARHPPARTPTAGVLVFAWATIAWVGTLTFFTQVVEHQRFRFTTDALATLLVAAAAREIMRAVRVSRRERSTTAPIKP